MFGSLFDEEDSSDCVMFYDYNVFVPTPPKPRPQCGLSGILNQGATCYLNSLIQTLLFTPEFKEGLFRLSESELGRTANKGKGEKCRVIPLQLQKLFGRLLLLDQESASTRELTDSFGWKNNEELQEHQDVQELNRILFSAIEQSLTGTSGSDLISKLYHGSIYTEIMCQVCRKISERVEEFLDLYVTVANFNNLQESLTANYLQEEIMKGTNQYQCSTCYKLVDAKKGSKIRSLPQILTFSLSRLSYDIAKRERVKEIGKFAFPLELNMLPYCSTEVNPENSMYELFSVVVHSGTGYAGHYHAYIRDIDHLGHWFPPDEEPLVVPTVGNNSTSVVQGPVSLIKILLSQQPNQSMMMDKLCQEIVKSTGTSWNKRFKNSFGPIAKFLNENTDIFFYNTATNIVYLKEAAIKENLIDEPMSIDNSPSNSCESTPGSPKEIRKQPGKNSLKLNLFDKKKNSISNSPLHRHWFHFNDAKVNPVSIKEIEKQFSGKESAYMLFYRRKSLVRPEEAIGNAKYLMPQWLLDLINEENKNLKQQRELHDSTTNTITLLIHFAENYLYKHGGLQIKENKMLPVHLPIDRRKPLSELKQCIHKVYCENMMVSDVSNLTVYTAKKLYVGYHLYNELISEKNDSTLQELRICEGANIFVIIPGKEMSDVVLNVGVENEPIWVNMSIFLPNGDTLKMSTGIPKSTTFLMIKSIITSHLDLSFKDDDIVISKLEANESKVVQIGESHVSSKLSDFHVGDNDHLVVECLSPTKNCDKTLSLTVEDRSTIYKDGDTSKYPYTDIHATLDTVIFDLKTMILTKFGLDGLKSYRLCKCLEDSKKGPPLYENQTVETACLTDAKCLILEEGMAPTEDEITISYSINDIANNDYCLELNISKRHTIQQCIKDMLHSISVPGDNWKLQKANIFGDFETIFTETITLEEEGIQHGDFLLLTSSYIPPKGFVNYKIWLYPSQENLRHIDVLEMEQILVQYSSFYKKLTNIAKTKCGLIELGDIELSSDSTIEDLKKSILTLNLLSGIKLPGVNFLRVRLLDGTRPTKVIRNVNQSTIKKLKLHNQQALCVQLLTHSEDLSTETILLNVCIRDSNQRIYLPASELSWDMKESGTLKTLKQELSNIYNIPVERLVIAKHFYDKFEWQVIEDSQKKGTKRWSNKKSSLRNAPYYLKDGDTIGIKDQINDPQNLDDFSTAEDIEGQEILKKREQQKLEAAINNTNGVVDGKRQRRQTRSTGFYEEWTFDSGDSDVERKCIKKPEKGIIIHVDDFR